MTISEWMAKAMHEAMLDKGYDTLRIDDDLQAEFHGFNYDDFREHFDKFEILPNGGIFILDPRSPMKKAIKITTENIERLSKEFDLDPSELDQEFGFSIGYWLIADFGAQRPEGYISEAVLNEQFDLVPATELTLRNDWVAIVDKGLPVL